MLLTSSIVIDAILFVLGCLWCAQVWRRIPSDWKDWQSNKHADTRWAIFAIWVLTVLILIWIFGFLRTYFLGS